MENINNIRFYNCWHPYFTTFIKEVQSKNIVLLLAMLHIDSHKTERAANTIRERSDCMQYIWAFLVGGAICLIGQILIDKTNLTPARILTAFVVAGVVLGAFGLYEPLVKFAGEGASLPISGFGNVMTTGVRDALRTDGALGILTGGLKAAAGGVSAAIILSVLAAVVSKPREK